MATFKYRAKAANGATITGVLEAEGRAAAFGQLSSRRLVVLNIEDTAAKKSSSMVLFRRQKVKADQLIFFTYQLAAMLRAGLPIVRSLGVLEEEMSDAYFREVIRTVREHLEGGESFSGALAKFPKVFNKLFVNLVSAGEQSGNLDEVLRVCAEN